MKKKYIFPILKERSYNPENAYADITLPGFESVGGEEPGEPEDEW